MLLSATPATYVMILFIGLNVGQRCWVSPLGNGSCQIAGLVCCKRAIEAALGHHKGLTHNCRADDGG